MSLHARMPSEFSRRRTTLRGAEYVETTPAPVEELVMDDCLRKESFYSW